MIYNGLNYDPWFDSLIQASVGNHALRILSVAKLVKAAPDANPHLWYNPRYIDSYADAVMLTLCRVDPKDAAYFKANLAVIQEKNARLERDIAVLAKKVKGMKVTATEPVFGYMAEALQLNMQGLNFQWAVMNDIDPSPKVYAAFEDLLKQKTVRALFYNRQVHSAVGDRMRDLAIKNGISVIGISETEPQGADYSTWMQAQLDDFAQKVGAS